MGNCDQMTGMLDDFLSSISENLFEGNIESLAEKCYQLGRLSVEMNRQCTEPEHKNKMEYSIKQFNRLVAGKVCPPQPRITLSKDLKPLPGKTEGPVHEAFRKASGH